MSCRPAGADNVPGAPADIDWDATLAFRHHLWSWGLGVADAMDTAQRNMGLDAAATRELITRSAAEARSAGGGAGRSASTPTTSTTRPSRCDGGDRRLQGAAAPRRGRGRRASSSWRAAHLARAARRPTTTAASTARCSRAAGARSCCTGSATVFDPQLAGYFGSRRRRGDRHGAARSSRENPERSRGVKMSLLDADHEIAVRARLPARRHAVHRRRLPLRRPHRGRRPAALRRAARRLRRPRPDAVGGDPGARRRRPGAVPRDPRPHRGAVPAGLRRADLLLQDRRRVPVVAERPPARVHDGRRPARGAQPAPPVALVRLADRGRRARAPGARRGAAGTACLALHGVPTAVTRCRRPARLSLNQATIKYADLPDGAAGDRGRGMEAIGLWREPVAEVGLATAAAMLADSGLRVSRLCRGGFFTAADERRAAPRSTTTAARSTRPRRSPRRARRLGAVLVLVAGGLPEGAATCRRPGAGRATPSATSRRRRRRRRDARDRAAAPDVRRRPRRGLDPRPGARHRGAVPGRAGRRRRRHLPRLVGPAARRQIAPRGPRGRIASYQVCDWITPLPAGRAARPAALWATASSTSRPLTRLVTDAGYDRATSRWRSSTRRSGTPIRSTSRTAR